MNNGTIAPVAVGTFEMLFPKPLHQRLLLLLYLLNAKSCVLNNEEE